MMVAAVNASNTWKVNSCIDARAGGQLDQPDGERDRASS